VSTPAPHPAEEGTQVGVTVAATGWRAYAKLAAYLVCVMAAIPNRTKGGENVLVTAQRAQAALNAPPPAVA
jgi:hypothetical protein